jgi:hypothetical protein
MLVDGYHVPRQRVGPSLRGQVVSTTGPLKMVPICSTETSATNYRPYTAQHHRKEKASPTSRQKPITELIKHHTIKVYGGVEE